MFKDVTRRIAIGLIATVLVAVASGIVLLAASLALYGAFEIMAPAPAAAALTAVVYAVIAAIIALVAAHLLKPAPKRGPASTKTTLDRAYLGKALEISVAALGIWADLALSRSLKRTETTHKAKQRR